MSDTQKQIFEIIKQDTNVSYQNIADELSIHRSTVMRNIQKLKMNGIISWVGSKKSGHWEINVE